MAESKPPPGESDRRSVTFKAPVRRDRLTSDINVRLTAAQTRILDALVDELALGSRSALVRSALSDFLRRPSVRLALEKISDRQKAERKRARQRAAGDR